MKQKRLIIEALNPVNIKKVETIIYSISKIEEATSTNLIFNDQYKFIFSFEIDDDLLQNVVGQIKSLLNFYGSTVLSIQEDLLEN